MDTTNNGFRFAELARGESLCSPTTCDCCGREELKRTIKLVHPSGRTVWYGTGCAAKAMSVGERDVKRAREEQVSADSKALASAQDAARRAEYAAFQAFLDARVPQHRGERFQQLQAMGGMQAARQAYGAVAS